MQKNCLKTIADVYFCVPTHDLKQELEEYRREFDNKHGPTNGNKKYTSQLPIAVQQELIKTNLEAYFVGLPLFARNFLLKKQLEGIDQTHRNSNTVDRFLSQFSDIQENPDKYLQLARL